MNKILLVVQREFLSRVKKKSFLIATLLTPLIFPAIMGVFVWIAMNEKENQSLRIIEVIDETRLFALESSEQYAFTFSENDPEIAKKKVQDGDRYGFLYIPKLDLKNPKGIVYYGQENPNISLMSYLESSLKKKIEDQKLYENGVDPKILREIRTNVSIQSITLQESGEEKVNDATVNYALAFYPEY
jgi:ABC-2 type transport system permease protein